MYQIGQKVRVLVKQKFLDAEILEFADYGEEALWWVKFPSSEVSLVTEENLKDWNSRNCTCGAKATYTPNPAPGHSYHCDVVRY